MEEIAELIRQYGLEEDSEYVIVPFTDSNGKRKRIFLLKRNYMRVRYPDEHVVDYPLQEIIEATVKFPESPLSEVMHLFHKEIPVEEIIAHESKPDLTEASDDTFSEGEG